MQPDFLFPTDNDLPRSGTNIRFLTWNILDRHSVPRRVGKSPAQSVAEFMDEQKDRRRHTPHGSSSSRTGTRTSSPNLVMSYPSPASRSHSYRAIGTLIAPIRRLDGILQDLLNYKVSSCLA